MAVLKSPNCLQKLKGFQTGANKKLQHCAKRALASIGNIELLTDCINHCEESIAYGMGLSGGRHDLWFMGPPIIVTDIARQNVQNALKDKNKYVPLALRTIAAFGDKSDIESVRITLFNTDNLTEFYEASQCLYNTDKSLTIKTLTHLSTPFHPENSSLLAIKALERFGEKLDVSSLFEYFCGLIKVDFTQDSFLTLVVELLSKYPLPTNAEQQLLTGINKNDAWITNYTWQIAAAQKLEAFSELAWSALQDISKIRCAGSVLDYSFACFNKSDERERFTALCIKQVNHHKYKPIKGTLFVHQLSGVLTKLGENIFVGAIITELFDKYLTAYFDTIAVDYSAKSTETARQTNYAFASLVSQKF